MYVYMCIYIYIIRRSLALPLHPALPGLWSNPLLTIIAIKMCITNYSILMILLLVIVTTDTIDYCCGLYFVNVNVYVYIYIYIYICMYMYIYIYIYICVCICVYIYIYIYI